MSIHKQAALPSAQPHSEMIQEFKGHPLLCTSLMANIQGVNQKQSQWNLHHFYSVISKLLGPFFLNFTLK